MANTKRQQAANKALHYDLFGSIDHRVPPCQSQVEAHKPVLPSIQQLYRLFERFNFTYFDGTLPRPHIEYSNRMTSAGSFTPHNRVIKVSRKYHAIFPDEMEDTLKHEMIHIIHFNHNAAFKAEAMRIGASLKAKSHPSLQQPPKYTYACPGCGLEYPRQKRLRMASCGVCSKNRKFDAKFKLRLITFSNSNSKHC